MVSGGLLEQTDASSATPTEVFSIIRDRTPYKKSQLQKMSQMQFYFSPPLGVDGD